jgi:curved DNA-binding protein CbpA
MPAPETPPDRQDHYAILGVRPNATPGQITRAYHALARTLHPDTAITRDDTVARFTAVTTAYAILHDPARRAAYNHTRTGHGTPPAAAAPRTTPARTHIVDLTPPASHDDEAPRVADGPRRANPPALRIGPTRVEPPP